MDSQNCIKYTIKNILQKSNHAFSIQNKAII